MNTTNVKLDYKEIYNDVSRIFYKRLGKKMKKILSTSRFEEDLHVDSLAAVEIEVIIEQKYSINIKDEEWVEIKTFGRLISLIYGKASKN